MSSTITLQNVVDFATTQVELMPLSNVGGISNEPALSLCNDALAELLSTGNNWKFNSEESVLFVTKPRKQTYLWAGASAWTATSGAAIDLATNSAITESGTTVTVKTLEAHGFSVGETVYMIGNTIEEYCSIFTADENSSAWSGGWVITSIPDTKTFVFTHLTSGLETSGAFGITNFGNIEYGSMVEMSDVGSPQRVHPVKGVRHLQQESQIGFVTKMCVLPPLGVDGTGTDSEDPNDDEGEDNEYEGILRIRLSPVPSSQVMGICINYQRKCPRKTSFSNTWFPFPDELAYVYRQSFLYFCYRFLNMGRAEVEYQKLQVDIQKAQAADDNELSEEHMIPERGLMDW